MKRIVRLVFNRILINVTDIFLRVIGINRIDPLIRKLLVPPPTVSAAAGSKRADLDARP
jgi:hypothetical protein